METERKWCLNTREQYWESDDGRKLSDAIVICNLAPIERTDENLDILYNETKPYYSCSH